VALPAYAAAIVSFLGGIHWGIGFRDGTPWRFLWGLAEPALAVESGGHHESRRGCGGWLNPRQEPCSNSGVDDGPAVRWLSRLLTERVIVDSHQR
jgi:hypothetical protein